MLNSKYTIELCIVRVVSNFHYMEREAIADLPGGKEFVAIYDPDIDMKEVPEELKYFRDLPDDSELCTKAVKLLPGYPIAYLTNRQTGAITARLLHTTTKKEYSDRLDDLALACFIKGDDRIFDVVEHFECGILI